MEYLFKIMVIYVFKKQNGIIINVKIINDLRAYFQFIYTTLIIIKINN